MKIFEVTNPTQQVWHGTIAGLLSEIKQHGLLAKPPQRNWEPHYYRGERARAVYVTTNLTEAVSWAHDTAVKQLNLDPNQPT